MFQGEGYISLFRAYGATLMSFGPFSALYLMLYEQFKVRLSNTLNKDITNEINPSIVLTSGASAGAIASLITNPLDLVKLRMQVQRSNIYDFGYALTFTSYIFRSRKIR